MKSSIDKDIRQGRIDECGFNLSKKFKPNDISGGMKYALGTGNWGSKSQAKNKKGIAQLLPRLSYLGTLSALRRIIAPIDRNGKQTEPRKLHSSQFGTICPFETPEGGAVGIVKNMAITCHITIPSNSAPIISALNDLGMKKLEDVVPSSLNNSVKVFINGDWCGQIFEPNKVVNELKDMRRKGIINIYTSIAWNIKNYELSIRTDGGRLCRLYILLKIKNLY